MTTAAERRSASLSVAASSGARIISHVSISNAEFDRLRTLIFERFGIHLSDQKKTLVEGRLQPVLRAAGYTSFEQYYENELAAPTSKALSTLVDRISTNFTYFNREPAHFDLLKTKILPELIAQKKAAGSHDLRIWCAAASTGEEPYMLSMLIREALGADHGRWQAGLLATDISDRALEIAKAGIYDAEKLEKLPSTLSKKYFRSCGTDSHEVSAELKKDVTFRRFNLMNTTFPFREPFDVIFCRNVMIYFETETKEALLRRIHRHLRVGGYLFVGHAESLSRNPLFEYVAPAAYRRVS